jgi:hypothetical protein
MHIADYIHVAISDIKEKKVKPIFTILNLFLHDIFLHTLLYNIFFYIYIYTAIHHYLQVYIHTVIRNER